MVIRRLFGSAFSGEALINKAISPDSPYYGNDNAWELFTITRKFTSAYGQDRNALTKLMPIFAGMIVMTQRKFLLYLLDVELHWP